MRTFAADPNAVPHGQRLLPGAVLANGSYVVALTGWATGGSFFEGRALTRWRGPRANDQDAFAIYVRDLDRDSVRTVGARPAGIPADRYAAESLPGALRISRSDGELDTTLDVFVAPESPLEVRRCTLRNRGDAPLRLELTSYLEVVLQDRASDLGHPAFSKLFVETEWDGANRLLLARRRPRAAADRHPWVAHTVLGAGDLEWETDRARFLGRGRDHRRPAAMRGGLSGTVGAVLDPILSLRCRLVVPPRGEGVASFLLAAAWDREGAVREVQRLPDEQAVEALRQAALTAEPMPWEALELSEDDAIALRAALAGVGPESGKLGGDGRTSPTRPAAGGEAVSLGEVEAEEAVSLETDNGYGGFCEDGTEYVIRLRRGQDDSLRLPPMPWINVLANESFGTLVSEAGSQHTWRSNSREHRLTPWSNDPIRDPSGEVAYLQDEATGAYWSLWPSPAPGASRYEVRHGFGYTTCRHWSAGLEHEIELFVSRRDPVKVARLRLTNPGPEPRSLALVTMQDLEAGASAPDPTAPVSVVWDAEHAALVARTARPGPFAGGRTFAALSVPGLRRPEDFARNPARHTYTADAESFLGAAGDPAAPAALERNADLDGAVGSPHACLAQRARFEIGPGDRVECLLLFGETEAGALGPLLERYRPLHAAAAAREDAVAAWRDLLGGLQVRTPSAALDRALNGWLLYQTLACRLWARTAFYQSGGAFGFRDQIQDAAALVVHAPERARAQLLLHAAHQFVEGDVLHWWHPELETGLRTRFADDLVWLPFLTAHYVHATGDESVLAEPAEFLRGRALEAGEDEVLLSPEPSGAVGDLYEHCARALDRSLAVGPHGLPLFGSGDWNDSMNRVGREGRGESVWMGFFLSAALRDFLPFCLRRGDTERALAYAEHVRALRAALDDAGWDGEWYRRGYYDDGTPLGSRESDECRIDALVQAWAVLSGAASSERARMAMASAERHLVSRRDGIIRLLLPAFDRTPHDPGYIKGYLPGVRENGGQYTHAALWVARAIAELGRGEDAVALLEMLLPESHARTEEEVARYQAEPYAIAADVYGAEPHVGRGGWTWYTGSAGWALRVGLESILGFRTVEGAFLDVRPCIPADWPSYRIEYRVPRESTRYAITVRRGPTQGNRVRQAWLDGDPVPVEGGRARIPLLRDGRSHDVDVVLGN